MKYIFIFSLLYFTTSAFAQDKISGKVVSEKNVPLTGASVYIPGTATGTVTGGEGQFTIVSPTGGDTKLAASYIGYEIAIINISVTDPHQPLIIKLQVKSKVLDSVLVRPGVKGAWSQWGKIFTDGFIGNSEFSSDCEVLNTEDIHFRFFEKENELMAYAGQPLTIINHTLGYNIRVELVDFHIDLTSGEVDFQMYTLFTPLKGSEDEEIAWKKMRRKVYSFSMMHFMRTLYSGNIKAEGYIIRRMVKKRNEEKERIKEIYSNAYQRIKDSLKKDALADKFINRWVEKSISKDSIRYYKKILKEEDHLERIDAEPLTATHLVKTIDPQRKQLAFTDYLAVTYEKEWEPMEYFNFRVKKSHAYRTKRSNPFTTFYLTSSIPIEINESGYFNNIDLFVEGFWGWWEKLATKLPYDYKP